MKNLLDFVPATVLICPFFNYFCTALEIINLKMTTKIHTALHHHHKKYNYAGLC
jgi:hypothetical protein